VLPARLRRRFERVGGDTHVSKDALRELIDFWIDKPKIRRFTPHDLRSTMKSHMRKLGVPRDISEMCLNHKLKGVEGIYDQHTYYDERRTAAAMTSAPTTILIGFMRSPPRVAAPVRRPDCFQRVTAE
jgi:integrase